MSRPCCIIWLKNDCYRAASVARRSQKPRLAFHFTMVLKCNRGRQKLVTKEQTRREIGGSTFFNLSILYV